MTGTVDTAMAELEKAEVIEETKDPWDFEDPEIDQVVEDTASEATEEADTPVSDTVFSDDLVERAKSAGLSDEDLETMGSADRLEFVLNLVENRPVEKQEEDDTAAESSDATTSSEPTAQGKGSSDDYTWIDELDPDDAVDTEQARALKAMKSRMDQLSSQLDSMNQKTQTVASNSQFSSLSEEWTGLFGEPAASERTPEQVANRNAVIEEMDVLRKGYRASNKKVPSDTQLFERAINSAFGDQVKDFARQELNHKLQRRENQFLSRASTTSGNGDLLTGRDKAMKNVKDKMRDMGFEVQDDTVDVFE